MNSNREVWRSLVAVEGIDGAGKTTLTRALDEALTRRGIPHTMGCEPTDGEIGRLIRRSLNGSSPLKPETLAMLFSADRREHLFAENGIASAIRSGGIYLTERYFFSSLAYQTLDTMWDWVDRLNGGYPLPGHLIYLSLPVDAAMGRLSHREERDIYETEELQRRVSQGYRRAIDIYSDQGMKVLELDARRAPGELLEETLDFLGDLFD